MRPSATLLPSLILWGVTISANFPSIQSQTWKSPARGTHPDGRQPSITECKQKLTGQIDVTQCDYETLDDIAPDLHNALHSLVRTPFFKYLKIDLDRECPFWESSGMCGVRDCAVTPADEKDIPIHWRAESLSKLKRPNQDELQRTFPGCYYSEADYCVLNEADEGEYVDLIQNPERFTGYAGPAARQVWSSIYSENCFGLSEEDFAPNLGHDNLLTSSSFGMTPIGLSPLVEQSKEVEKDTCLEKKVYYRIISGLHASISTHLCAHSLDQKTGQWGPSLPCFMERLASHPERIQYIYFNTVLLLRAVSRAGNYLSAYDIHVGSGQENVNQLTSQLLKQVISVADNVGDFDETILFRGEDAKVLKEEFKTHFRNVSRIMDCVGCEKCRLWGKIQTSGIGTALKILFELDENLLNPTLNPHLLQRSELVTLINTLHQLTESIIAVDEFQRLALAAEKVATASASIPLSSPIVEESNVATPVASPSPEQPPIPDHSNASLNSYLLSALKKCKRHTVTCLELGVQLTEKVVGTLSSALRRQPAVNNEPPPYQDL